MTRRALAAVLLPSVMTAILGLVALGAGWKYTQWAENRRMLFPAVEQNARAIDAKTGESVDSPKSASAMAAALKSSDDGQAAFGQFLQSLGVLILMAAGWQARVILRARKQEPPSNGDTAHSALRAPHGARDRNGLR